MDVKDFLESKGIEVTESGDNYQINCPICGDTRNRLGIHMSTGKWRCFNCDEKGQHFRTLQKHLTDEKLQELEFAAPKNKKKLVLDQGLADKFHKLLFRPGRTANDYLKNERGFSEETIAHFQLGSWKKKGFEYVAIPFWKRGQLVNFKYRAVNYTDKKFKWRRQKGGESVLYHHDVVDQQEFDHVYLTEAELDCVALYNAGVKNVLAVTTGAKGFKQEWYDQLERFKKIYLVYDNDIDGQEYANKVASRLGYDRCFNIVVPRESKDINNYFWDSKEKKSTGRTLKDFQKLAKDAKRFEVRDTQSVKEALKEIYKDIFVANEEETYGLDTPWDNVNKIMGGSKPGHLVVVSAPPKIGKTTFALNWMRYLAKDTNTSTYLYCCEMRPKRLAEKLIAMECPDFTKAEDITKTMLAEVSYSLPWDKIWFGYPKEDVLTLDNVCDRIKEAVQRYGCRYVCFDNLHFLIRGEDAKEKIGEVTRRFKLLAETLNIVFVLIVHPRKVGDKRMTADDLKDSSSIYQDLDTLIMLHRKRLATDEDRLLEGIKEESGEGDEEESFQAPPVRGNFDKIVEVSVQGRWTEGGATTIVFEGNRSLFHSRGAIYRKAILAAKKKRDDMKKKNQKSTGRQPTGGRR